MPTNNSFRHQVYAETQPVAKYTLMGPCLNTTISDTEPAEWKQAWARAGVQAVYLVHGTFTGDDALGVVREIQRFAPSWGEAARKLGKSWVDRITGDAGNYSDAYRQQLQDSLGSESEVPVRRFLWSGENNHLGRAEAAIRLLDLLLSRARRDEQRIVLWGHSHAGNVFALITNLVGGDAHSIHRFFRATRSMGRTKDSPTRDACIWRRVRRLLLEDVPRQTNLRLTFVTYGTPIRYGWETRGYDGLLHFVHHRPTAEFPRWRTVFPFGLDDLLDACHGDYIHQLGIAGTDFLPSSLSYRRWNTERRVKRLIGGRLRRRNLVRRLRVGMRVPAEGQTLLVDYPDDEQHLREQLLGHAIYTKQEWLGFHLREVTRRLFSYDSSNDVDTNRKP